ncbi:hypothetical protein FHR23_002556 [Stakelama sediminis]|uniref:Uncharacterized protein n=1 Tax=Stakelama sediminis TaxID=463200 RepID=A0A840Z0V4_9SPHN|nr:hypothetical protein [Stakelama sediminis]
MGGIGKTPDPGKKALRSSQSRSFHRKPVSAAYRRRARMDRHSEDDVTKIVDFRDPARSVLSVREHWKHGKPLFAGHQG